MRHLEDPCEAEFVVRIGEKPQVGDHILDLFTLEKARRPRNLVGNPLEPELLFVTAHHRVGAQQDRVIAVVKLVPLVVARNAVGDPDGLVLFVVALVVHDRVAVARHRGDAWAPSRIWRDER